MDDQLMKAWRDFTQRLEALGEELSGGDFPASPDDRAEGFRHLAEHAVLWLGWSIGYPDPAAPAFHRQNDLTTRWGGPNVDNIYRHARIDPSHRYRITGRMHSCEDFILAIRAGFMHMERWGTVEQVSASDLGIGEGQDFEILLGGDAPGAVALPEAAAMASIREYYFDWRPLEPATMTIECLDAVAPPPRPTAADMATRVDEAIVAIETSVRYWHRYLADARAAQQDNAWGEGFQQTKGLDAARYMFCFFDLAPDEALVAESDVPDARYWSFQLYRLGWFEPFDFAHRVTSLNHTQAVIDGDGRVRAVLAPEDPGVANWLDSEGRRNGLLMYRWFWPRGDAPRPTARVVKLEDLRDTAVDPATRATQIAARRTHVAWRFRT